MKGYGVSRKDIPFSMAETSDSDRRKRSKAVRTEHGRERARTRQFIWQEVMAIEENEKVEVETEEVDDSPEGCDEFPFQNWVDDDDEEAMA